MRVTSRNTDAGQAGESWPTRIRKALVLALGGNATLVVVSAVIALVALVLSNTSLSHLLSGGAYVWSVLHLGVLHISGGAPVNFSAMPLLGAVLVIMVIARVTRERINKRVRVQDVAAIAIANLIVPSLVTVLAWWIVQDHATSILLAPTLGRTLLVHTVATVWGMGQPLWRALARRYKVDESVVYAAHLASRYAGAMLAVGAVAVLISLGWHYQTLMTLKETFSAAGDFTGLIAVSAVYGLDAALGACAGLVGGSVGLGNATVSLGSSHAAVFPPLPLLAAWPHSVWPYGWALFAVPAIVAALTASRRAQTYLRPVATALLAGVWLAIFGCLLALAFNGEVGLFGERSIAMGGFAVPLGAWFAGVGSLVALVTQPRGQSRDEASDDDATDSTSPTEEAVDGQTGPALGRMSVDEFESVDGDVNGNGDVNVEEHKESVGSDEAVSSDEPSARADVVVSAESPTSDEITVTTPVAEPIELYPDESQPEELVAEIMSEEPSEETYLDPELDVDPGEIPAVEWEEEEEESVSALEPSLKNPSSDNAED